MFERYTEKARRVIFFARYEACTFGSPYIESEFLLLGLLREDRHIVTRWLGKRDWPAILRKEVEKYVDLRPKTATSVDLPLSNEVKRVLANAAEEAEHLGHHHIGTEHLFLGLLREPGFQYRQNTHRPWHRHQYSARDHSQRERACRRPYERREQGRGSAAPHH